MSDRMWAKICIGGALPESKLEEFKQVVTNDFGLFDQNWNEYGHLIFEDGDVSYGRFEEIEDFCIKNKLSFIRESGTDGQYDPELSVFIPDTIREELLLNHNGAVVTPAEPLRGLRRALKEVTVKNAKQVVKSKSPHPTCLSYAKHLLKGKDPLTFVQIVLEEDVPPDNPEEKDLPPFTIKGLTQKRAPLYINNDWGMVRDVAKRILEKT